MSLFSSSQSTTQITDNRTAASDSGIATGSGSNSAFGGDVFNFSGINTSAFGGKLSGSVDNRVSAPSLTSGTVTGGSVGSGAGGGSGPAGNGVNTGDVSVSIVTNDPAAAIAAIETNTSLAQSSNSLLAENANKNQRLAEKTIGDALKTVESIALPAGEKTAQTYAYIAAFALGIYLYYKYKTK